MSKTARTKTACCLFLLFFLPAALLNGVCVMKRGGAGGRADKPCIMSIDVCGHGPASSAVQGFDAVSALFTCHDIYFPLISVVPPIPAKAVASAEPGETEKPPRA